MHKDYLGIILKNIYFVIIIYVILGAALLGCILEIKKGNKSYIYYLLFFISLTIIRIVQQIQWFFSPQSLQGLVTSLIITVVFIVGAIFFYLGYKKEQKIKK